MGINKFYNEEKAEGLLTLAESLTEQICTYYFSVLFTRDSECVLYTLNGKKSSSSSWNQIITHPQSDNDGEITIEIGKLQKGTSIDLIFGIYGNTEIPHVAILITNFTTNESRKVLPKKKDEYKKVEKGTQWNQQISNYELF